MNKILIIDDEQDICLLLKKYFSKKGYEVHTANSGKEGLAIVKEEPVNLVLCDFKLPDYTGLEILQKLKIINSQIQVVIITGYSDVKVAVEALKKGAFDYVTKPLYPDEILLTVQSALKSKVEPNRPSKKSVVEKNNYVNGQSPSALLVQKHIDLIAPTDMSVIILGETGTGKEYVAQAIHKKSKRKNNPFVAVDCGALPNELAGSELFGHVKGAFTNAIQDKKGCFELAHNGTLFLDEIGNLSYENQIKLLRVLQEKVIRKIGGVQDIPVEVRVIVATNEDLKQQVKAGEFREDMYHRLNEFKIELAPLRERKGDIALFADHFLNLANEQLDKSVQGFKDEVMDVLNAYYWHGNLRELQNVVKRSVLLCQSEQVDVACLPQEITEPDLKSDKHFSDENVPLNLKAAAEQAEKRAIELALKKTDNNKSKTAEILGVDRKTLYNKLNAYKIDF